MLDVKKLKIARDCLTKSRWGIDDILRNSISNEKAEKHLKLIMMSMETAIGNIYETIKKLDTPDSGNFDKMLEIVMTITPENWLNIRINSLLPNNRTIGSAKLLSSQIKAELVNFSKHPILPKFDKAYLAIIEHCDFKTCKSFDHDNKNLRVIPNCLKGIIFPDDSQFYLSLGMFTAYDETETYCDIYVLPQNEIEIFDKKYLPK